MFACLEVGCVVSDFGKFAFFFVEGSEDVLCLFFQESVYVG